MALLLVTRVTLTDCHRDRSVISTASRVCLMILCSVDRMDQKYLRVESCYIVMVTISASYGKAFYRPLRQLIEIDCLGTAA